MKAGQRAALTLLAVSISQLALAQEKAPAPATQAQVQAVDQRLQRIERLLDSQGLIEMLNRLDRLQQEVQKLRGDLEFQTNTIEQLRTRQRELYVDLDGRIQKLERGGVDLRPRTEPADDSPPLEMLNTARDEVAGRDAVSGLQVDNRTPEEEGEEVEKETYRQAFNMLKAGQYENSISAFRSFMGKYPESAYADNAQYWLGEAYYMLKQYEPAVEEYQRLVANHPQSQKLTHALLKIGYSQYELGKLESAEATLKDLRTRYPGSTAARMAGERLQEIAIERSVNEPARQPEAPAPAMDTGNQPEPLEILEDAAAESP